MEFSSSLSSFVGFQLIEVKAAKSSIVTGWEVSSWLEIMSKTLTDEQAEILCLLAVGITSWSQAKLEQESLLLLTSSDKTVENVVWKSLLFAPMESSEQWTEMI